MILLENVFAILFARDEEAEGQGLVEYALIIVLVAIAVIAVLGLLGTQVGAVFTKITGSLAA